MAAGDVVIRGDSGRTIRGVRVVFGQVTLDGSNATPIALAQYGNAVLGGVVSLQGSAAPALDPSAVTCLASGTTLNVYAWKVTSAGDTTLVASTNNARIVDFVAFVKVG